MRLAGTDSGKKAPQQPRKRVKRKAYHRGSRLERNLFLLLARSRVYVYKPSFVSKLILKCLFPDCLVVLNQYLWFFVAKSDPYY